MSRVLHVISGLGMGGAERNLFQVATGLGARGSEQRVVCLAPDDNLWSARLREQGIGVDIFNVSSKLGFASAVQRLVGIVGDWKPTILQGWMAHGNLVAALAHRVASGRRSRKLYWNLRASNLKEPHHLFTIRLTALLSRWPDLIISNSQAGLDFHLSMKYRPRDIVVIENGIDTGKFIPDSKIRDAVRQQLDIPADCCVALHAARVDPMKDHQNFFSAMDQLPGVRGIMIGAGTETLAAPPNITALGMRKDIAQLYPGADLVVSSSAYAEGFSNAVAEGMSCGLIPIATDVGDARRIVGETGYIVPASQPQMLASAIRQAAGLSKTESAYRAEQARQRISSLFSLEAKLDMYAGLYA